MNKIKINSLKNLYNILLFEKNNYGLKYSILVSYFIYPNYRINCLFRIGQYLLKFGKYSKIFRFYLKHRLLFKYSFDTDFHLDIGKGFRIQHIGNIVINLLSKIGENVRIQSGVTLGKDFNSLKPILGDNIYIGTGSKIIGGVKIGSNVNIGALTIVHKDVPSNSVVVGTCRIIENDE